MKNSFKDKLKQHQPEWDKEAFWTELEPALPEKDRRRRFAWWRWLLPAGLLVFGLAAWHAYAVQHADSTSSSLRSFAIAVPGELLSTSSSSPTQQVATTMPEKHANNITARKAADSTTDQRAPLQKERDAASEPAPIQGMDKDRLSPPAFALPSSPISTAIPNALPQKKDLGVLDQAPALPVKPVAGPKHTLPTALLPSPPAEKADAQWYQSFSLGIAQPVRHFRNAQPEVQEAKQQQESLREVSTVAYLIGYRHPSGLYAQAGLQVQQRRELLQWEGVIDSSSIEQNSDRAYFIYDQNGQPDYQSGPLQVLQLTRRRITQQNYYRMLNLPVQLGYTYRHQRWSGFAEAGVSFNLFHSFSGKFIDADNQVQDQQTINQDLLQRRLGVGWSAALGASYQLTPAVSIYLKAEHQQFRRALYQGQGYGQWYGNWGLSIGVAKGL
jgi:opacity protein-like surface antigen